MSEAEPLFLYVYMAKVIHATQTAKFFWRKNGYAVFWRKNPDRIPLGIF